MTSVTLLRGSLMSQEKQADRFKTSLPPALLISYTYSQSQTRENSAVIPKAIHIKQLSLFTQRLSSLSIML